MSHEVDDLAATAEKEGVFSTFLAAAHAANLIDVLRGNDPFTLFAPTDNAFAKVPATTLSKLMKPPHLELLMRVVGYHLALGAVRSRALAGKRFRAKTYEGSELRIDARGDVIIVNGAPLARPDRVAANGVLHGIDHVLWPKATQARTASPRAKGA